MPASTWMKVARSGDGEIVGYLAPLAPDWSEVQPYNLLGHAVGGPTDFLAGEERLLERGISELAERWQLRDPDPELCNGVVILEVSQDGIVVAHADLTKALVFGKRLTVPWPDVAGALARER